MSINLDDAMNEIELLLGCLAMLAVWTKLKNYASRAQNCGQEVFVIGK